MRRPSVCVRAFVALVLALTFAGAIAATRPLDRAAERWIEQTRKKLTLDEPGIGSAAGSDYLIHDGKDLEFTPDFSQAKVLDAIGKLGRGKRVDIPV